MGRPNKNIAVLVLAAGASTRMGATVKQLLPWKETTLLGFTIANAHAAGFTKIHVVLGANASAIEDRHREDNVVFLVNTSWVNGLGSSLALGARYLMETMQGFDAVLVLLGDQPLIDPPYLNKLSDSFYRGKGAIIATNYGGGFGVPALFDRSYLPELANLGKDQGAKEILKKNKSDILIIDPKGKAIDIDTLEDYNLLIKKFK